MRRTQHHDARQVIENQEEPIIETVAKVEHDVTRVAAPESREAHHEMSGDKPTKKSKRRDWKQRPQQNRAVGENSQDKWKEDLLKRVKELEQAQQAAEANLRKITAEKEALNKEVEHLRQTEQLRTFQTPPSRLTFIPRDCPPQQHYSIICFKCREPGHKARECPQRSNASVQFDRNSDTNGLSGTAPVDRGRYLRVTLSHRVMDCLIDSGSEVCLFPRDAVPPNCIRATESTLTAANGVSIPILGEASLPLSIGEFSTIITVLVSSHVTEPMLGIDFLIDNGVVCDFAKSSVIIAGVRHLLLPKSGRRHWCRKVALQGSVPVPVNSRVILPTKVQLKRCPDRPVNKCQSVGLGQVGQGLHGSHTLLMRNAGTHASAKVLNVSKVNTPQRSTLPCSCLQKVEVLQRRQPHSRMSPTVRPVKNRSVSGFTRKLAEGANVPVPKRTSHTSEACFSPCLDLFSTSKNDSGGDKLRPDTRRDRTVDQRDVRRGKRGGHFVSKCPPHQF